MIASLMTCLMMCLIARLMTSLMTCLMTCLIARLMTCAQECRDERGELVAEIVRAISVIKVYGAEAAWGERP